MSKQIRYKPKSSLVLCGINCILEGGHKLGIVGWTGSGDYHHDRSILPCGAGSREYYSSWPWYLHRGLNLQIALLSQWPTEYQL